MGEALDLRQILYALARFGFVGALATAIFFTIAAVLPMYSVDPTLAAAVGSVLSVVFSYIGHHSFTFSRSGKHQFYLPRFLVVSAVLSTAATAGTFIMTDTFGFSARASALVIAISYPAFSFGLNSLWVFGALAWQQPNSEGE